MTVLKGPLAVKQSKALIKTFKMLKDWMRKRISYIEFCQFFCYNTQNVSCS